jgi:hypothetical protein
MHYIVECEFIEENLAGKTPEKSAVYIEQIVHPSLEALRNLVEEKKIVGGVVAGVRQAAFVIDVGTNAEVGKMLRSLPFWGVMKWTVTPLQSFQSAIQQDLEAIQKMRSMVIAR